MTHPTAPLNRYRPAAGIAIFNSQGRVFLGRRKGAKGDYVWQMPQGGIDKGESPEHAAIRECFEETGIDTQKLSPLGEIADWLCYDLPKQARKVRKNGKTWRGQKQRWFAFRFHGTDLDIDLKAVPPQEFSEFRWGTLREAQSAIVPFKRDVYKAVAKAFSPFETPYT